MWLLRCARGMLHLPPGPRVRVMWWCAGWTVRAGCACVTPGTSQEPMSTWLTRLRGWGCDCSTAVSQTPPSPAGKPHIAANQSMTTSVAVPPSRFSRLRYSSDILQDMNLTQPLFLLLASGPMLGGDQPGMGRHDLLAVSAQPCWLGVCGSPCHVGGGDMVSLLLLKAHGAQCHVAPNSFAHYLSLS